MDHNNHINLYYLFKPKDFAADGIGFSQKHLPVCEISEKSKMVRKPFRPSKSRADEVLQLVHSPPVGS